MQPELEPLTDTLKPIYANFIFREQPQALAFAGLIAECDWSVSVAYAADRARWRVTCGGRYTPCFKRSPSGWLP
ncbi:MAG TPA: hypothetical protein VFC17_11620 [Candidatus Limnocylindrales bacterium]|nr:hypothetical protein [Candidatus Limnocylindrales bacterium]